jgi:hypothetical protein
MTVADSTRQTLQQQNAPAGTGAVLMLNQRLGGTRARSVSALDTSSHKAPPAVNPGGMP